MSGRAHSFKIPIIVVCCVHLLATSGYMTASAYGQASANQPPKATYEELKARIRELEARNRELETRNKDRADAYRTPAVDKTDAEAPEPATSIQDIEPEDEDYRFLLLGQQQDYLQTERWRIIDQIEQAIPPLFEPVRPFHGYTLPPGVWRIGLKTTFARNPGSFGRNDFYSLFFDNVKVDTLKVDLDLLYGFEIGSLRDLTAKLNIPYKFQRTTGTGHPFRIDPLVMTMEGAGEGIGDISFTLKKKWMDQGNGPFTFSTMTGIIFPTAEDDQEFNSSQTLFMKGMPPRGVSGGVPGDPIIDVFSRHAGERLFPRSLQPGNGSWGARFGFGLTRQFERSALHGGAVFDLLADNDGITPGHELRYGISYVFPPFDSDRLTLDLSLFGFWKGDEKFPGTITHAMRDPNTGGPIMNPDGTIAMFTTARPDFEHGNILFVSPSLIVIPRPNIRLIASPAFRVLQPERGPSPEWMLTAGVTLTY